MTLLASLLLCLFSAPSTQLRDYLHAYNLQARVTDCGHKAIVNESFVGSAFGGRVPFGERGRLVLSVVRGRVVWTFVSKQRSVRVGYDDVEEGW